MGLMSYADTPGGSGRVAVRTFDATAMKADDIAASWKRGS